jgi:sortase A
MSKNFAFSVLVAIATLAALPLLPATLTAETEPHPAEAVPANTTSPTIEETTKPPPKVDRQTKESALEKLSLKKLTIEKPTPKKPVPEKPPPAREPTSEKPAPEQPAPEQPPSAREPAPDHAQNSDQSSDRKPRRVVRAGATSVPVLPGSAQKAPEKPPSAAAPPAVQPGLGQNRLLLSIPKLGLENVPVGDSSKQSYLDREGIMHLSGTGLPYERGSNTYIVGHAGDFEASRIPNVFRNLSNLRQGDLIVLRDAMGRTYNYRAYEYFVVNPRDVWITKPIAGKQVISLQTCFPTPTFEKRLIVRGELVR